MTNTTTTTAATLYAVTEVSGRTVLTRDGHATDIDAATVAEARQQVLDHARTRAADAGHSLLLSARDPGGTWLLTVHPDGRIEPAEDVDLNPAAPAKPGSSHRLASPPTRSGHTAAATPPAPTAAPATPTPTTPAVPQSFLPTAAPAAPPRSGWRGALARFGLDVKPSAQELAYREDVAAVSQHWAGPRTIAIVNGKGGSAKTPHTVGLAAVFARFGGGGVCAWGNHQLRGTLGWHTVQNPHAATTADLLASAPALLEAGGRLGDLARFVHHQPADMYDVLQADPTKTADRQRSNHQTVGTVHQVLSRYYRLILIDTDNDESAPHWLGMLDHVDLLVVSTTNRDTHAETGRLMLEDLKEHRGPHARELAERAVVLISQADIDEAPPAAYARRFEERGLRTATIPYDRGMKGFKITFDGLAPATQRAYLAAGAVVARALP